MRILVTGASGFLGSHLCRRLLAGGNQVAALLRPGSPDSALQALDVERLPGDLLDPDSLRAAVRGCGAVIHAAAVIRYSAPAAEHERVNLQGTRNVARACRQERVSRLVHVSSVSAIGIPDNPDSPAGEDFPFNLEAAGLSYHLSKKRAEDAVLEESAAGLDAVIVNPASIFGPHGNHYRGGDMIRNVAARPVTPYFRGGICAVHVADVVSGTLAALEKGARGRRYILGGDNVPFREIARRSLDALHASRPLVPVPPIVTGVLAALLTPAGRRLGRSFRFTRELHYCASRFMYYKSDRATAELGYNPRPFDAIIREALSHSG